MQSPLIRDSKRRKTKNFFLFFDLPEEISLHILSFLTAKDMCTVAVTSRELRRFSQENVLWRKLCKKQNWVVPRTTARESLFDFKKYYSEKACLTKEGSLKWNEVPKPSGAVPTKRFKHTATVCGKQIIFIGGQETDTKRFNEIVCLDTETNTFSKPAINGDKVPNFSRHTACLVKDRVYVFGGFDGFGTNFDLAIFDPKTNTWTNVNKSRVKGQIPASRTNHAAAAVGSRMFVFGGNNNNEAGSYQVLDDLHVLDVDTLTWSRPAVTGDKPTARSGHCLITVGKKIVLFGGGVWNETAGWVDKFNEIFVLDTDTFHWTKPTCSGVVETSTFAIPFAVGRFLFIFGGGSKPKHCVTNDMYILDTATNVWSTPNVEGTKPLPRDMGTASVVGSNVYFLGGYAGGAVDYFDKLSFNSCDVLFERNRQGRFPRLC